jgi:hypothetical protein
MGETISAKFCFGNLKGRNHSEGREIWEDNIKNEYKESWVQGVGGVRQIEMHTAEPLVPEPSASDDEVAIGKMKIYKSPGFDQFTAELIQAGGETLRSEIHKLIKLIWNKEELPHQWKESIVVPNHKKGDKTDCSNYRGISLLSSSYKILSNILLARLTQYADEIIGNHQCGFRRNSSTTDHIFIFCRYWRKNGSVFVRYVIYLQISGKSTIQSGGKYYTVISLSLHYSGN